MGKKTVTMRREFEQVQVFETSTLANKGIDYVSMCRPFIIEPAIVKKFQENKKNESNCINCSYCLMGVTSAPLRCYYGKIPCQ